MLNYLRCARADWCTQSTVLQRETTSRLRNVFAARLLPWKPHGASYSTNFSLVSCLKKNETYLYIIKDYFKTNFKENLK